MKGESSCETCGKVFKWQCRQQVARFCSRHCLGIENAKRNFPPITDPKELLRRMTMSFEKYVIKKEGCWGWNASILKDGYPQIGSGRKLGISKGHRASWVIHKGAIPEGFSVLHKCDNRICTNPDHLFLGKPIENSRDMVYKGRQPKGAKNGSAKLTNEDVLEIRDLSNKGVGSSFLSEKFSVSRHSIWKVKTHKTWTHVKD